MTNDSFKDEVMPKIRMTVLVTSFLAFAIGCSSQKPYGEEEQLFLPGTHRQVWAVAPAINLSGQSQIDPLLQSDLVYQELQKVRGLTVIPVDRVVEVYASLKIDKVQSERQAYDICRLLGCDGLVVPTVTAYDPYDPPKFGASVQLFVGLGRSIGCRSWTLGRWNAARRRRRRRRPRWPRRTTWPRWLKCTMRPTGPCWKR